ncbi:MAG: hypothetical protein QXH80_03415 [Candidatus Nanoarchaeia archaeon]
MNKIKQDKALTDTDIVHNAPPIVAFTTIALGSFRGLVADILWLRSSMLQEKGQYFEMVQIASWITKLQPRFTGAISYLAWNMSYNISVVFSAPEDRWRWVKKGIELIRDEALQYNPADPILYKELGWIYQHKIGNIMDDVNLYYKQQMALDYMKVFGGIEPDWEKIIRAPSTEAEFKMQFPESDPIWKSLLMAGFPSIKELEREFRKKGELPREILDAIKDKQKTSALEWFLRKKWLKEVYKLDPAKMNELNQKYGVFDWRLPEAHAIYWATLGLEKSKLSEREVSNDRMITQSLKEAFIGGRLLMIDKNDYLGIMTVPNLKLTDAVIKTFKDAYEMHKSQSFRTGALKNFMTDAIVLLYSFGNYTKAQAVLEDMRKEFPEDASLRQSLDIYVEKQWKEDVMSSMPRQAAGLVSSMVYRALYFLAYGEYDAAVAHMNLAAKIYKIYRKERGDTWKRTGLPSFTEIKRKMTEACLANFPPELAKSLEMEIINLESKIQNPEDTEQGGTK